MQCETCDGPITVPEKQGRPRRYCARACQQKAYRERRRCTIPAELTDLPRWVCWEPRERNGKTTKVPLTTRGYEARVNDPRTWTTFARASAAAQDGRVGIVLGAGLGCIDLDDCIAGGVIAAWAQDIIDQHRDDAIFIERSPSKGGVHIFLPLAEAPGRRIREAEVHVEIYSRARYIAVTGDRL